MSFYWRSPYLSRGAAGELAMEPDGADVTPRVSRSAHLNRSLTDHVSPQDWFDSSMPSAKNHNPTVFRRAGTQIKGILKTSQEKSQKPRDKIYRNSDKVEQTTKENCDKKEKKKVTFDNKDTNPPGNNAAVPTPRGMSAHQLRIQLSQPFNELTKQNLKKLLGFASATLPPVSGKSIIPKTDRPKSSSAICKHGSDLKCANCIQDHHKRLSLKLESFSPRSEGHEDSSECHKDKNYPVTDPELSIGLKRYPSPTESRHEKKGDKHWTSSFVKSSDRRKQSRHVPGRYPFSAGTTPRQFADLMQKVDQKIMATAASSKDSVKLQVTGGNTGHTGNTGNSGNVSPGPEEEYAKIPLDNPDANVTGSFHAGNAPGSARSDRTGARGIRGYKIAATSIQHQPGTAYLRKPATAQPLRMKTGQSGLDSFRGDHHGGHRDREHYNMDKTQQILSWLQDVKQKDGYRPRHARLYALETQQTH